MKAIDSGISIAFMVPDRLDPKPSRTFSSITLSGGADKGLSRVCPRCARRLRHRPE